MIETRFLELKSQGLLVPVLFQSGDAFAVLLLTMHVGMAAVKRVPGAEKQSTDITSTRMSFTTALQKTMDPQTCCHT